MVRAFAAFAFSTLVAQTMPLPDAGAVSGIERLGLVGTLILGIVVIGRAYLRKDAKMDATNESVTKALTTAAETARQAATSNEKLHEAIEQFREAQDRLTAAVNRMPCTLRETERARAAGAGD